MLREDEISTALREVRMALLEADVTLEIIKKFIKSVGEKARGQAVTTVSYTHLTLPTKRIV